MGIATWGSSPLPGTPCEAAGGKGCMQRATVHELGGDGQALLPQAGSIAPHDELMAAVLQVAQFSQRTSAHVGAGL